MQLSRQIAFERLVIDSPAISRLIELIASRLPRKQETKYYEPFDLLLRYSDQSEVTLDTPPKDFTKYLDRRIVALSVTLRTIEPRKLISVALNHGRWQGYSLNGAVVTGNEEDWVNDVYTRLDQWRKSLPKQFSFLERYILPLTVLLSVPLGFALLKLLVIFFKLTNQTPAATPSTPSTSAVALAYMVMFAFALILSFEILNRLALLWPPVELRLGPDHELDFVGRRKRVGAFIVLLLLPVFANFVTDLVKLIASF